VVWAFDSPARAIRCAASAIDAVHVLGLQRRAGCHTGEIELAGDDIRGVAVHAAGRIAAEAEADEILVSGTVKELVAGSAFEFRDRARHKLKGLPNEWPLYAVS
jgi:class 3 adenylate cyclase